MRKKLLLFALAQSFLLLAQKPPKVDLDRFSVYAEYQVLPEFNIPYNDRTYFVSTEVSDEIYNWPDPQNITNEIRIEAWKLQSENPNIFVNIRLESFRETGVNIVDRLVEEKNKEGKVIKSYKLYKAVATYTGRSQVEIKTNFSITTTKKDEKAEGNRFLNATKTTTDTGEKNFSVSLTTSQETQEYKSSYEAEKNYKLNKGNYYNNQLKGYQKHLIDRVNYNINSKFGFRPTNERFILWIIDSKGEEGVVQKEAIDAVKAIFDEMKAHESLTTVEEKLQPLIAYFESLKTKYPNDDKGSKKIRYSAYFNLGKIYYYLDQPEKAIIEGQGVIDNGYDKKDGKEIIEDSEKLIKKFNERKFNSRHNLPLN